MRTGDFRSPVDHWPLLSCSAEKVNVKPMAMTLPSMKRYELISIRADQQYHDSISTVGCARSVTGIAAAVDLKPVSTFSTFLTVHCSDMLAMASLCRNLLLCKMPQQPHHLLNQAEL